MISRKRGAWEILPARRALRAASASRTRRIGVSLGSSGSAWSYPQRARQRAVEERHRVDRGRRIAFRGPPDIGASGAMGRRNESGDDRYGDETDEETLWIDAVCSMNFRALIL